MFWNFLDDSFISVWKVSFFAAYEESIVSNSPVLVDFAIGGLCGLVNSVFNLSDGQVMFFEEFE